MPAARGRRKGARHARHDVERHAGRSERQRFFAAATEDERIAALQPHDAPAALRGTNHHGVNVFLRQRVTARALADEEALRPAGDLQDALVDERVVQHQIGRPQTRDRRPRQKARIARPAPTSDT